MDITVKSLLLILNKMIDILLVWGIIYFLLKSTRKNVKLTLIFKGILFVMILKLLADTFNLLTIGLLLEYIIMWGPLAIIIIFQPEIRLILEQIGRQQLLGRHKVLTVNERENLVNEIAVSLENFSKTRTGALIVIERDVSLRDYIKPAKPVYSKITSDMLMTIFFPNTPLHDGGVIIQGNTISCAGAVFPVSQNIENKKLGTRHRAALGISEETDALVVVCSEETGKLSLAINGELYYGLSLEDIRITLLDELRPKNEEAEGESYE